MDKKKATMTAGIVLAVVLAMMGYTGNWDMLLVLFQLLTLQ